MTETGIQEKVMEAVVIMNTAIINLRLYPPTNAMIMKTIERLYDTLQNILEKNETISLAESERNLLISGESLTQQNRQKPQVAIFLLLMITWGIKSISFHKGLDKSELSFFLEMLGKKRDDAVKEKGVEQIISEGNMPHIQINQKIFVELDQDHQIVASPEIEQAREKEEKELKKKEERGLNEEEERETKIRETKEKINDILNKFETGLPDESDVKALPGLLDFLYSEEETGTAEATIERLTAMLQSDRPDIRAAASESLAGIFDNLSMKRRAEALTRYLDRLTHWMKLETTATGAFRKICERMKELAEGRIQNQRFADSLPILDTFSHIVSNRFEKNDQLQSVASEILREVASRDILGILIEEFQTDKQNQRKEAGKNLLVMAEHSIDPLLDLLLVSEVSSERVLILNLIPEMGNAAAPAIIARIEENAPWYYLRNIARLLGRTGSEEDAKVALAPLLLNRDLRVQKEAFRSINTIGGSSRGEIFLNALSGCDDQLKVNIVTSLGSLKHTAAVKPLIELFKAKTGLPEEMKVELQEKICVALGNIGNREALPFLKEVSTQSGIFGFKSYKPKVQAAAVRASGMLSKT